MFAVSNVVARSIYVSALLAISVLTVSTGVAVIHPVRTMVPGTVHVVAASTGTADPSGIGWD